MNCDPSNTTANHLLLIRRNFGLTQKLENSLLTLSPIKSIFINIRNRPFISNVLVVASGTALSQVIIIVFSPLLTRIFDPAAFGVLGTFVAITSILAPITAMCYPIAIVLPRNEIDARALLATSLYISAAFALLVSLLIYFFGKTIVSVLAIKQIQPYLWLIPIAILAYTLVEIFSQFLIRHKQFKITAQATVAQSLLGNLLKLIFGVFKPFASLLILLTTFSTIIHLIMLVLGIKKNSPDLFSRKMFILPLSSVTNTLRRYYDFPLYRAPQVFINAISTNIPVVMIASLFGPASAGFYALCRRSLSIPTYIISKSVGDVFYPRITDAVHNNENASKLILKATLSLAAIGIFPFGLVVAFGPWLFSFVFGDAWKPAGIFARYLAMMGYILFINRPSIVSIPTLGIQKHFLYFEVANTIISLFALYFGYSFSNDASQSIMSYSLSSALLNALLIIYVISFSRSSTLNRHTADPI